MDYPGKKRNEKEKVIAPGWYYRGICEAVIPVKHC